MVKLLYVVYVGIFFMWLSCYMLFTFTFIYVVKLLYVVYVGKS